MKRRAGELARAMRAFVVGEEYGGQIDSTLVEAREQVARTVRVDFGEECPEARRLELMMQIGDMVGQGYERSRLVNGCLLDEPGVPEFPGMEEVKAAVLPKIGLKQMEYLLSEGSNPFKFQLKLETPGDRIDLQRRLLEEASKGEARVEIDVELERQLANTPSVTRMAWKWEFVQGQRCMDRLSLWEAGSKTLGARVPEVCEKRPSGFGGMDRFSWATLMADHFMDGKALDIEYFPDSLDANDCKRMGLTVLDEEGMFGENLEAVNLPGLGARILEDGSLEVDSSQISQVSDDAKVDRKREFYLGACYNPYAQTFCLQKYAAGNSNPHAYVRATLSGYV